MRYINSYLIYVLQFGDDNTMG